MSKMGIMDPLLSWTNYSDAEQHDSQSKYKSPNLFFIFVCQKAALILFYFFLQYTCDTYIV